MQKIQKNAKNATSKETSLINHLCCIKKKKASSAFGTGMKIPIKMQLPTLWLNFSFDEVASRCKRCKKNAIYGQNLKSKKMQKKMQVAFSPPWRYPMGTPQKSVPRLHMLVICDTHKGRRYPHCSTKLWIYGLPSLSEKRGQKRKERNSGPTFGQLNKWSHVVRQDN